MKRERGRFWISWGKEKREKKEKGEKRTIYYIYTYNILMKHLKMEKEKKKKEGGGGEGPFLKRNKRWKPPPPFPFRRPHSLTSKRSEEEKKGEGL